MVQRYHADKISTHPEGAITLYSDYAALEQRCREAEEHAGTRWKELDAERQSHTITKRELEGVRQRCRELEAENVELRKRLEPIEAYWDDLQNRFTAGVFPNEAIKKCMALKEK